MTRNYDSQLWTYNRRQMHVAFYRIASLLCTCLLHTFSKKWISNRGDRNLDYRCVYAVNNVICVKTGLDWQNLRFKMERIRKKRKTT